METKSDNNNNESKRDDRNLKDKSSFNTFKLSLAE